MVIMDVIEGYLIGTYFWVALLMSYDLYLNNKLRKLRFKAADYIFNHEGRKKDYLNFDPVANFLMLDDDMLQIAPNEKYTFLNKHVLVTDRFRSLTQSFVGFMLSPILISMFIVATARLFLSKIINTRSNHNKIVDSYHHLFIEWWYDKRNRIEKASTQIKKWDLEIEAVRTKNLYRTQAVRMEVTTSTEFNKETRNVI